MLECKSKKLELTYVQIEAQGIDKDSSSKQFACLKMLRKIPASMMAKQPAKTPPLPASQ